MASRITGLAVAVLATTALAVAASSAKDTTKVETSLNFSFFSNLSEPGPDYFWGRVKAKDPGKKTRCERGRKVTVYGYAHHRRHVIGSDRSNDRGMYKVISSSVYYARLSPFVAVAQEDADHRQRQEGRLQGGPFGTNQVRTDRTGQSQLVARVAHIR